MSKDVSAIRKGRLRREPTIVVSVRMTESVYDRYCEDARLGGHHVRTVLRRVLTRHAPRRRVTY